MTAIALRFEREVVGTDQQLAAVIGGLEAQGCRVQIRDLVRDGEQVQCVLVATRSSAVPSPPPRRRWPYAAVLLAAGALLVWLVRLALANQTLVIGAVACTVVLCALVGRIGRRR